MPFLKARLDARQRIVRDKTSESDLSVVAALVAEPVGNAYYACCQAWHAQQLASAVSDKADAIQLLRDALPPKLRLVTQSRKFDTRLIIRGLAQGDLEPGDEVLTGNNVRGFKRAWNAAAAANATLKAKLQELDAAVHALRDARELLTQVLPFTAKRGTRLVLTHSIAKQYKAEAKAQPLPSDLEIEASPVLAFERIRARFVLAARAIQAHLLTLGFVYSRRQSTKTKAYGFPKRQKLHLTISTNYSCNMPRLSWALLVRPRTGTSKKTVCLREFNFNRSGSGQNIPMALPSGELNPQAVARAGLVQMQGEAHILDRARALLNEGSAELALAMAPLVADIKFRKAWRATQQAPEQGGQQPSAQPAAAAAKRQDPPTRARRPTAASP